MRVVTMLNQKGGVGKTSTTFHLSATLAALGLRVLLVDNDPQASLTQGFFGPVVAFGLDPAETVAALYRGDAPYPSRVIRPTGVAGVDIVPGSESATSWNFPDPHRADESDQRCVREFLDESRGDYDLALIDCPPNLHLCSWAALVASDFIVVPMQAEDFGAQGIAAVRRSVAMVQAGPNPGLQLAGYLLTMFDKRRVVHQSYEEMLRDEYGDRVFSARVPDAVAYVEAVANRRPIELVRPKKTAPARAIREVAEELISRVESMSVPQRAAEVA